MKILLASSEVFPFSKTGGLADMVGALAGALANEGHEARVVTPLYRGIRDKIPGDAPGGLAFRSAAGAKPDRGGTVGAGRGARAENLFHRPARLFRPGRHL
jgi:glycogen synthase